WNGGETLGVTVDYAYFAVPMGDWTIDAGRMPLNYSKFYSWDIRPTRLRAIYKHGNFKIIPFLGVVNELSDNPLDAWDDNDFMQYGIVPIVNMSNGWTLKGFFRYNDDAQEWDQAHELVTVATTDANGVAGTMQVPKGNANGGQKALGGGMNVPDFDFGTRANPHADRSGFDASVHLNNNGAKNSPIGFEAEVAYVAADYQKTEDDGLGAYVQLSSRSMGAFTPAVVVGLTQDGFVADNDFGFVMVGGNESTTVVDVGNRDGDLMFGAFVASYAVSPRLTLTGNLLYADYDNNTEGNITDAIEVSGVASYALADGANLTYKAGYLAPGFDDDDAMDDPYFGHLVRLELEF
ncbi:MAG: hypothetical protein D3923_08550, partial [Candidatus Electrothrix sp. AR3]|nr:hypothetical protein [Candidatus Electrothrix sp. AR3]